MTEKFEKITEIDPAYDYTNDSSGRGIGCCMLRMILKGKAGAISFSVFTQWYLPETTNRLIKSCNHNEFKAKCFLVAHSGEIAYHSPVPLEEYQKEPRILACRYLDNRPCYGSGSCLGAEPIYETLLKEGSKGVWKELEKYYCESFKDGVEL